MSVIDIYSYYSNVSRFAFALILSSALSSCSLPLKKHICDKNGQQVDFRRAGDFVGYWHSNKSGQGAGATFQVDNEGQLIYDDTFGCEENALPLIEGDYNTTIGPYGEASSFHKLDSVKLGDNRFVLSYSNDYDYKKVIAWGMIIEPDKMIYKAPRATLPTLFYRISKSPWGPTPGGTDSDSGSGSGSDSDSDSGTQSGLDTKNSASGSDSGSDSDSDSDSGTQSSLDTKNSASSSGLSR